MIYLIVILSIFFRYFLTSYLLELWMSKIRAPKIVSKSRKPGQKKQEMMNSAVTSIIFGIGLVSLFQMWEMGHFPLVNSPHLHWWSHPVSIVLALFIHETYYYWMHRMIHHKSLYPFFHKRHHDSIEVSTWTAQSFNASESILQLIPFYIILKIVPLHLYSIFFLLTLMTVSAAINHLNVEIYPKNRVFNWIIGATHHAKHHKEFRCNYGLYFTFWDKIMKTNSI